VHVLEGHSDEVSSVAFSPDGKYIVSGAWDKAVQVWSAATGKKQRKMKGHSDAVRSVAFSSNGTQVVSGSKDKSVQVWDATTGKLERILEGHLETLVSVAFSRDGKRIVSGSKDNSVRVWNTITGEMERVLEGHSNWTMSVAFSPDGKKVVSGSHDHSVRIWDTMTGEVTLLPASKSIAFPDGGTVTHIMPGIFQLLAPGEKTVSISQDKDWLLTEPPMEACSIPPEFRGFYPHAFSGSKACFGYGTGLVVIVDLKPV